MLCWYEAGMLLGGCDVIILRCCYAAVMLLCGWDVAMRL